MLFGFSGGEREEEEGKKLKCNRFLWLSGMAWLWAGQQRVRRRSREPLIVAAYSHLSLSGRKYKTTT